VHFLLRQLVDNPVYRPAEAVVGTSSFKVSIAPECSGYEGIGLVLTFLSCYLWFFRDRFRLRRAWILLPLGAVSIWLANIVRIFLLILVGSSISPEIAAGGFHSQAGWIAFNAVTLGLIALASSCSFFTKQSAVPTARIQQRNPEAIYLFPLLTILGMALLTGAFSSGGLDRFYPLRLAAVAIPLWSFRREYASMQWSFSWQSPLIGVLVFVLWIARWPIEHGIGDDYGTEITDLGRLYTIFWLTTRAVGAVLTVPFAEELAFRGFLTRRLISADFESVPPGQFRWMSFLVSSAAFGILHDRWLEGTLAGMLYAIAYYRRGSIGDAFVAHATTNGMLTADALVSGDWSLWS
jgi:exosortase E/protease (VPEID-CTERM system)